MNDSHPACLDPLLVARLMCTRLCHDLAAPIGAVSNGAELMGADPSMIDAEMLGLLTDSAAAASLRLRTLRAAFGLGGAVDAADVPRLLSGWVAARTIVTLPDSVVLSRLTGEVLQILLNMALVAYDAALAPRSLVVSVAAEGETVITGRSRRPRRPPRGGIGRGDHWSRRFRCLGAANHSRMVGRGIDAGAGRTGGIRGNANWRTRGRDFARIDHLKKEYHFICKERF